MPASALSTPDGRPGLLRTNESTDETQVDPQVDFLGARNARPGLAPNVDGLDRDPGGWQYVSSRCRPIGAWAISLQPGGHSIVYVDGTEVASTAPFQSRTLSLIPTSSGLTNARAA